MERYSISDISIRTVLQPGDMGYIIHRHGVLYQEEYQYGIDFESYVAEGFHQFHHQYDASRDRVWIAEFDGTIIGFVLLMHRPGNAAQLRYFYVEAPFRGIGLGAHLMELFMEFYREAGYNSAYLWTTHELPAAAALYKRHGFNLTEEKPSTAFGKAVLEQRYDLKGA